MVREGVRKLLRARVELRGKFNVVRLNGAVMHVARREQRVAHFQGLVRIFNVIGLGGELTGIVLGQFDQFFVGLDLLIDLSVEFAAGAHLLEHLVLVGALGVFQSQ